MSAPRAIKRKEVVLGPARKSGFDPGCVENVPLCYDSLGGLRGQFMKRFVEGAIADNRRLLPECLDEWVEESNSVRVIDFPLSTRSIWPISASQVSSLQRQAGRPTTPRFF